MNSRGILKVFGPLVVLLVVLELMLPRASRFPYNYQKGGEWKYETLFAEFDFPLLKTPDQLRSEVSGYSHQVAPYFRANTSTTDTYLSSASVALGKYPFSGALLTELRSIYRRGVVADEFRPSESVEDLDCIFLVRDKNVTKTPSSEVYTLSGAREKMRSFVGGLQYNEGSALDSLLRGGKLDGLLAPNLVYDSQLTALAQAEERGNISETSGYVSAGQLIISKGDRVTPKALQVLDSYKKEYEANTGASGPGWLQWLGDLFVALAVMAALYFAIYFACPALFEDERRYLYVMMVVGLFFVLTLLFARIGATLLYYVPYTLAALMLGSFLKPREVLPIYIVTLSPLLLTSHEGALLLLMSLVAGVVALYAFRWLHHGWKQFVGALITFAVLSVVFLSFRFADLSVEDPVGVELGLFVGSFLTVAGYPLVYLFERIFNLASEARLMELCDTSSPLLRMLEQKAPGTFQHSLQVMNMSDAVSRAVGANIELVKAAALYHDIGKTSNPLCFVENESLLSGVVGAQYHDGLQPLQSTRDILSHVSAGVEIARRYHLPEVIIDFIRTHHGTTLVSFFFSKFLQAGGSEAEASVFRYAGPKPRTREQVILMLCDSVEAASRTLKDNTQKGYSDFVDSIINGKLSQGQLDRADVTVSELKTMSDALKQYLAQLNHERISYPKNELNNK